MVCSATMVYEESTRDVEREVAGRPMKPLRAGAVVLQQSVDLSRSSSYTYTIITRHREIDSNIRNTEIVFKQ